MPPAPKKQGHEDISTSSRGDLPPQSPGMQAVHRLLEKINKKTNKVDPLQKNCHSQVLQLKDQYLKKRPMCRKKKVKQSAASGTVKPKVSLYSCDICGAFIRERLDRHYVNAHKLEREKAKRRSRVQKSISLGSKKCLLARYVEKLWHISQNTLRTCIKFSEKMDSHIKGDEMQEK